MATKQQHFASDKPHVPNDKEHDDLQQRLEHLDAITDYKLQKVNTKLILLNVWSLLACISYGYTAAAIGSTLGFPSFYAYYGGNVADPNIIGTIVGVQSLGGAVGVILVCIIQDRYGRKMGFLFGAGFALLGSALAAGATNTIMLIFGRLFSGLGCWAGILSASVYASELAPATRRGDLAGLIGPGTTAGYLIAGWLSVGFYYVDSAINFRIALILQVFFPLVQLAGLPFAVESPRWLSFQGRNEEALAILVKIHRNSADPESLVAKEEAYQIQKQAELDLSLPHGWGCMFTKYKKRTFLSFLTNFAGQATGIQIVSNYGPRLYQGLGLSPSVSLIVAAAWLVWACTSQTLWVYPLDRIGRRFNLIFGCGHSTVALAILVALIAIYGEPGETNKAGQRAIVFMFFWFLFAFSAMEPAYYLYITEIFPNQVRVKGIAVGLFTLNITAFWGTLSQPTGVARIGWKYYLVFVACSAVNTVLLWYFVVETRGVPLEEMSARFGDEDEVAINTLQKRQLA